MGTEKEVYKNIPLIPSSIKKSYKQLYLKIFTAENLPKMDTFLGTIDAYCSLKFNKSKLKTRTYTQKDGLVQWYQEMMIPVELPIKDDNLILKVYDEDKLVDEICASVHLSIKSMLKHDISNNQQPVQKWINLYGAPMGFSGDHVKKMNNDPKTATCYKGRIFVEYYCEDVKYPVFKIRDIP